MNKTTHASLLKKQAKTNYKAFSSKYPERYENKRNEMLKRILNARVKFNLRIKIVPIGTL